MQLHTLVRKHANKNKKPRVGRSGKRGTTSGKGQKGQKSRSGRRIRPAIRDFIQRLPKRRGHRNVPKTDAFEVINLQDLTRLSGTNVTVASLKEAGLIKGRDLRVKLLGDGDVKKAFTVEGVAVSESAKKKITAAGGTIK